MVIILTNYDEQESSMLHTKFCQNRSTGSGEEDFEGFYHIWTWLPSWSCGQHHVNKFYFQVLKSLHINFG